MHNYDDPYDHSAGQPRTLAEVQPPPPHPVWLTFAATLGGLIIPAAAAIAAAILLGPPHVPHASRAASLAAAALTVAEAIFAGLGAAALVEAGWRRVGMPGSGPANFLPLRYLRHRMANRHVKELIAQLRDAPAQPSRESVRALLDLSRELARRDIYTRAHSGRVSRLSVEVGQKIGLSPEECEIARLAGLLHDIGKLEIPSAILNKPGPLDPDEAELVRNHPNIGAALVAPYIGADVVEAVRHHHERVDGAGYPDGIDGDALPIISRLVPVVDTYDALISDRSYRPGRSREEAFIELRAVAGTQLDAELVEVLIELESAKAPMGGALLGLAPIGALARKAEHLLHNSAAPAAAAITAIAVAGAGWLGVMSASTKTNVSAERPSTVNTLPTPTPSVPAQDQPAAPAPNTEVIPTPTATASAPPPVALFFPGPGTKVGKTAKSGGVVVVPKSTTAPSKAGGTTTTTPTKVIVIPNPTTGAGGSPAPAPSPTSAKPPPPPPAPSISGISPTGGPASTPVTISGANFSGATSVKFGSTVAFFTINDAGHISATAPAGSGTQPVTVTGPGGTSNGANFAYVGPKLTSISNSGLTGIKDGDIYGALNGGTSVTIHGSGFSAATAVKFGNDPANSFQVNSDSQITASAPAFSGTAEETVSVTTPAGTGTTQSGNNEFDYDPNLASISPSSGHAGTTVKITGSNFSGATGVSFGNNQAISFSVGSGGTQITAVAPSPASASVDIVVTNDAGGSDTISEDVFRYNNPNITGISSSGNDGDPLTISGSGFTAANAVRIGAVTLGPSSFSVNGDGSISTTVPAGIYNTQPITVTTPVGSSNTRSFTFQAPPPPPPSITGVNLVQVPTSTVASGYSVTIVGTNLAGASAGATVVTWNGSTISGAHVTNSQITFDAPLGTAPGESVTVVVSTTSSPPSASNTFVVP
ncbi:MAG TPA: HD domain-containing phosphohydrolase [Actinomycetota bacterium]|nr:HD domain-containing phosphohydrolase [Actinomycetota bacterium]